MYTQDKLAAAAPPRERERERERNVMKESLIQTTESRNVGEGHAHSVQFLDIG